MLVGNDVVDLRDPESRPEAIHARFDARAFGPEEREALNVFAPASAARHELRWTLWAAKESAYKVAKKLDPAVRFLPREFVAERTAEGRAVVMQQARLFDVRLDRTEERVHAIATFVDVNARPTFADVNARPTLRPITSGVGCLGVPGADPSQAVRELACVALCLRMSLPAHQVRITADGKIPFAVWQERKLPVDLSLSHHGRFVAWAWTERAISADPQDYVAA